MSETKPSFAIKALRLPEKAFFFGLSSSELLILARIVMFTKDGTQSAFYSNSQVMNDLQFSLRTVMRSFRTLEEQKIIFVELVKVNGVNQRQITLNLAHPMFTDADIDNLTIDKKTIVKKSQEGSQNDYNPLVKMTTTPSQNDYPTIRNIYKENNKDNNKENIYGENSQKTESDLYKNSIAKSSAYEFSENEPKNSKRADTGISQSLEDVCAVFEKPERGAISDTHKRQKKPSAKLVRDNPPTYEETLELVKNVINTHIQERIKENKSYEYTQGLDASNEAHSCLDYYEANGFTRKQGNKQVPLTSWKLAVSGWVRRHLSQLLERYSRGEQLYARPKPQQTIQGLVQEAKSQANEIRALLQNDPFSISNDQKLIER
ncbi:hypothetical protein [Succinatimonas hippei]|uniref:hypothetical protein n=1 Tax=Succinatimonas hippei TaxID=626938 RepID=UPI00249316F7|nr:hypothetical protein [Succinatimonas hippei]